MRGVRQAIDALDGFLQIRDARVQIFYQQRCRGARSLILAAKSSKLT